MRRFFFAFAAACTLLIMVALPVRATGAGGWDHVGSGSTAGSAALNGTVTAINTDNPGVLYVGGNFTNAGGVAKADRIARWDGSHWSAVSSTPLSNGQVFAIAYHAGTVYIGGTFVNAGGNTGADFLAAWNGTSWVSPCDSTTADPLITANVNALQIIGSTLYIGGSFQNGAGIVSADRLVACDLNTRVASSTVDSEAHEFNNGVTALTADSNGTLYAGGSFINLESIAATDHVAEYSGSGVWQSMGNGPGPGGGAVDSFVRSLTAVGTDVYVGTDAVDVAGVAKADHVARWDGLAWSAVGANTANTNGWFTTTATIDALAHYGSTVFAAGSFQNANGIATADDIAYFDGTQWRPLGSDGAGNGPLSQHPTALGVSGGQVYIGGAFTSAGGDTQAEYLAAHALRLPDASIGGSPTGHFAGANVYSPTGAGEIRNVTIARGSSKDVYVEVQNDGVVSASFRITAGGGASGISAHYFVGSSNVTADVDAGTYATVLIAPRGQLLIRVHVTVTHGSASHATLTTAARSQSGTPPDAVRLVVTAG